MKRYSLVTGTRALLAIVRPSLSVPPAQKASIQNSPNQAVGTMPRFTQEIDFSEAGPVLDLVAKMHSLEVIKTVQWLQPSYILRAPKTPIAPKTVGIMDQRLFQDYPPDAAKDSYNFSKMGAPARNQSIPGYVVKQTTQTRSTPGYPKKSMRAPSSHTSGGGCE